MAHPLDSARAKLRRAHEKMEELDDAWQQFCSDQPPPITTLKQIDADNKEFRVVIGDVREPPIDIGIVIGEVAHALRNVLDHLVWELAFVDNGCRGKGNDNTAFPLCGNPSDFPRRVRTDLGGVSKDHVALIELAQPYHPWYGGGRHPLGLIAALDNDDKHKVVQTTFAMGGPMIIHVRSFRDCRGIPGSTATGFNPMGRHLELGTILLRQPIQITGPNPDVEVYVNFGLDCALRDLNPVRLSFTVAAEFVEGILGLFEPAFEAPAVAQWRLREGRFPYKTTPQIAAGEVGLFPGTPPGFIPPPTTM